MAGEKDLNTLLTSVEPFFVPGQFVFVCLNSWSWARMEDLNPLATMQEKEGLSLVLEKALAVEQGFSFEGVFRCISLTVHSDLEAVGLTAAFSRALADEGISANVIAGLHHDHILVPERDADRALKTLERLGK